MKMKNIKQHKLKLLCVCSCNLNRSPTFEHWFTKNRQEYKTKSAGIYAGYPNQVNRELLDWADKIIIMDLGHKKFLKSKYPDVLPKTYMAGISDQFDTDEPELLELIEFWVEEMGL